MNEPVFHGDLALFEKLSGDALSSLHLARRSSGPVLLAALPAAGALPAVSEAAYLAAAAQLHAPRGAGLLAAVHAQGGAHLAVAHSLFIGVTLSDILDKARQDAVPMAADLSLLVAEKVAESLKQLPAGLRHTLISAECVLISYEGEITVIDAPLAAALANQPLTAATAGEARFARLHKSVQAGKASPRAEIWQLGALLLEMVSGEPFTTRGDIAAKIVKQCDAQEIGADIREVIERSLVENSDAYRTLDEFREAAGKLIYQGAYAPSTFNLAFFMHTLYRGEDEIRAARIKSLAAQALQFPASSAAVAIAAAPAPAPKARPVPPKAPVVVPTFGAVTGGDGDATPPPPLEDARRAGLPMGMIAGGVIVLLAILGGGFLFMHRGQSAKDAAKDKELAELQAKQLKLTQENEKLQLAAHESDDLKAQKAAADRAALDAKSGEEKKKAEEEQRRLDTKLKAAEERRKLQEEAVKKQTDVVQTAETRKPALAAEPKPAPAVGVPAAVKSPPAEPPPAANPAPASQPAAEPVKEIYTAAEVDSPAKLRDDLQPDYPNRGRGSALVFLRLVVDVSGAVVSAEVVKSDDVGYGFNEAAIATAKKLRYVPAIKDGRPVKCSVTKTYKFKG